ncbi:unnamed protein product [Caenorhabditis nigoni]
MGDMTCAIKIQCTLLALLFLASCLDSQNIGNRVTRSDDVKKEPQGGSIFKIRTTVFFFIYGFLVLFVFIGFLVWRLRRSKFQARNSKMHFENICQELDGSEDPVPESMKDAPINDKIDYLPYKRNYEIAKENLEKGPVLGHGMFGVVKKGYLKMADPKTEEEEKMKLEVAVKSVKNTYALDQISMLAAELRLMCAIGKFPNVLALVGAVTSELRKGHLLIVTEYIDQGDLLEYVRKHRHLFEDHLVPDKTEPGSYLTPLSAKRKTYDFKIEEGEKENAISQNLDSLTTSDLLSFGLQIANGMQYLSTIPLVHRDLALRNVLLKKNKTIRIADFGLARKYDDKTYYKQSSKDVPVPIRWMSPEAVHNMKFTQQSDVWSFGICLYELFTLGGLPYPTIENEDIYVYIQSGRRCLQPDHCHVELYDLMKLCWNAKPELRPTFTHIVEYFVEHMKKSAEHVYDYVEDMLRVEAESQRKLDDWIKVNRCEAFEVDLKSV